MLWTQRLRSPWGILFQQTISAYRFQQLVSSQGSLVTIFQEPIAVTSCVTGCKLLRDQERDTNLADANWPRTRLHLNIYKEGSVMGKTERCAKLLLLCLLGKPFAWVSSPLKRACPRPKRSGKLCQGEKRRGGGGGLRRGSEEWRAVSDT